MKHKKWGLAIFFAKKLGGEYIFFSQKVEGSAICFLKNWWADYIFAKKLMG